jgi:hypothetical protein
MTGNKARERERETERETFGERVRETQWREKMAWVIWEDGVGWFDRWSKSTTPEYFLNKSINGTIGFGCQSRLGWFPTFLG